MKNLPPIFYSRLEKIYSKDECNIIIESLKEWSSFTTFRVNTIKSNKKEIEDYLNKNNIVFQIPDFSEIVYIIDKKHEFTIKWSDIFYSWKIYIQWISSMIPVLTLDPKEEEIILDVTAAPWSKTTQMASIMNNTWIIEAIEHNQIRFDKLNYNVRLQWVLNTNTHKIDAHNLHHNFTDNYFDKILLDAPCSAEWRMNLKNEKSFWFWTLENISKKQKIQLELLETVIPLLKEWWVLVYSTCTLAPEENEEVIDKITKKFFDLKVEEIDIKIDNSIPWIIEFENKKYNPSISKTIRILPSKTNEWFFIAKLRKI